MIGRRWPLEAPGPRSDPPTPACASGSSTRPDRVIETVSSVTESVLCHLRPLRLTADGHLKTCLFAEDETDLREPARAGADDDALERIVRAAVLGKGPGHGMADPAWSYEGRPMNRIGG